MCFINIIFAVILSVFIALTTVLICLYVRNREQNQRFLQLAEISGEYIFEYDITNDFLNLSEKCLSLLSDCEGITGRSKKSEGIKFRREHSEINKAFISFVVYGENPGEVTLSYCGGTCDIFRVTKSEICTRCGKAHRIIGKIENVSLQKAEHNKLLEKATHDGMTGLLNSESFKTTAANGLSELSSGENAVLMLIDIDNFKGVNDTYGHVAGDKAVCRTAEAIKKICRTSDLVGRVGGDEFCVFMSGQINRETIIRRMNALREYSEKPSSGLPEYGITLSIGVSVYTDNEEESVTFLELYSQADKALYESKRHGKNRYSYYGKSGETA